MILTIFNPVGSDVSLQANNTINAYVGIIGNVLGSCFLSRYLERFSSQL